MSSHMRTHHTNLNTPRASILYVTYNHQTYAIPKNIARKYIIKSDSKLVPDEKPPSVPAQTIFENLEKKLTKAGALLKGLRIREGLSQIAFSKKIKVTQANLSNMENGRRPIGKTIAKRLEKVFSVDYRYFID